MHAINYTKAVGESDPIREINLFKSSKNEMNSGRLLKDACHYELDFLERIDRDGHLYYDEKYLEISIMRYEKYWLPLLASLSSSSSEDLKVPLFVHYQDFCHSERKSRVRLFGPKDDACTLFMC